MIVIDGARYDIIESGFQFDLIFLDIEGRYGVYIFGNTFGIVNYEERLL